MRARLADIDVGYTLGGAVVLWVAARRTDLVTRATVASTSTVVGRRAAGLPAS